MALMILEMHTAERLVPEPSSFKVEIAIKNMRRYTFVGVCQILQN
jgi:hypothetical protein